VKIITSLLISVFSVSVLASSESALKKTSDSSSIAHGAQLYRQYCSSCHSIRQQSYKQIGNRVGWSDTEIRQKLFLPDSVSLFSANQAMMPDTLAKETFGVIPPDLSLYVTQHGKASTYQFLNSFYSDPLAKFGANNYVVPNISMPNVLGPLKNSMKDHDYKALLVDVVNYLNFSSDPSQHERESIGLWVLFFLVVFFILVWLLKKEYWRDVH